MAIMLRSLGIPARLVIGFRSGEYNPIGDHWIVRQSDAHSWVEAFIPPYGWTEFDPTPPEPPHSKAAILGFLSQVSDAMNLWWWESVVNYDSYQQYRFLGRLRDGADGLKRKSAELVESAMNKSLAGIRRLNPLNFQSVGIQKLAPGMASSVLVILILLAKKRRRRLFDLLRRTIRRNRRRVACAFYSDALNLLADKGLRRGRGQTPLEFALSLRQHPAGECFLALTQIYNAARFGPPGAVLNSSEAEALLSLLRASL